MAFVTIANYSQASFELGYAMKFMRIIILICTAIFNIWGFVIGIIFSFCAIIFNRTIAGKSYIYPLIPFHLNELKKRFLRGGCLTSWKRMKTNRLKTALHPKAISGRITGISQNNRSRHQAGPFISTLYENQLYSGNAQKPLFPAVCTYKHRHLPELWQIPDPLLLLRYLPHCLL